LKADVNLRFMFFIAFTWLMYSLFSTLALAPFGGSSIKQPFWLCEALACAAGKAK